MKKKPEIIIKETTKVLDWLQPFNPERRCIKCGSKVIKVKYRSPSVFVYPSNYHIELLTQLRNQDVVEQSKVTTPEYMLCECIDCGYGWGEETLDKEK